MKLVVLLFMVYYVFALMIVTIHSVSAFLAAPVPFASYGGTAERTGRFLATALDARRGAKRGQRTESGPSKMPSSVASPVVTTQPSFPSTKRIPLSIPLGASPSESSESVGRRSVSIIVYQVNDPSWWKAAEGTENPYGARCWPSSLAVAECVVNEIPHLSKRFVLELGCGPGIPSLAAAACGAQVVATDVSPLALSLLQKGWNSTQTKWKPPPPPPPLPPPPPHQSEQSQQQQQQQNAVTEEAGGGSSSSSSIGSLEVQSFDLFSKELLPLPKRFTTTTTTTTATMTTETMEDSGDVSTSSFSPLQPIVLGCSMTYDAKLAKGLAKRFIEACRGYNAWVILGDDDTGERDGGRAMFLQEFERLEAEELSNHKNSNNSTPPPNKIRTEWVESKPVKNALLGWQEKTTYVLHINRPLLRISS